MKNGKSQCCGVVTFSSRKEAEQAIWGMDACPVENTFLEISILDENNEMASSIIICGSENIQSDL